MNELELTKQLAATQSSLNIVWTLMTGYLVMFMQAGFALVETGLTRAKNVTHTMAMNLLVYGICIVGFWALGFALQMGGVGPLTTFGGDATLSREFFVTMCPRARPFAWARLLHLPNRDPPRASRCRHPFPPASPKPTASSRRTGETQVPRRRRRTFGCTVVVWWASDRRVQAG